MEKVQKRAVALVSRLKEKDYEGRLGDSNGTTVSLCGTTLTERCHRAEMQMVHKIMRAESRLDPETLFKGAADSGRETRLAADLLNTKPASGRLENRRQFFKLRVTNNWNRIVPAEMKRK